MNVVFYLHDEPSAEAFERKLLWFRRRFRLVSYAELTAYLRGERELHGACHLTVDDGWLSTYRVIFPVLKKYGVPMTIFVSPRVCRSGENFWYADYGELPEALLRRELVARGLFDDELSAYPLDLIFKELPTTRCARYWLTSGGSVVSGRRRAPLSTRTRCARWRPLAWWRWGRTR